MRLRTWGALALVFALAAACITIGRVVTSDASAVGKPHATKPNVLFILTDDLDLSELGHMPNLRSLLIDQGVSFSNYFVSVSLCCPSRSTTLRGQYSHNTGVETNAGRNGGFKTAHRLGIERSTIATWLSAAGYRTALFGKYLNGYPAASDRRYVPPGWNVFDSPARGLPYSEFNYTLNENGHLVNYGNAPSDYGTDVYVRKAQDFIKRSAATGNPFFAYLSVYAPHQPATPAPRDAHLFRGARAPRTPAYNAANVTGKPAYIRKLPLMSKTVERSSDDLYRRRIQSLVAVDDGIGKLVETLRATGQLDNTYIVFTSDNGFHLGQFRMRAGKQTPYDFDVHVPLIVRGPGIPAHETANQLVGNEDLAPTFAAMADVVPPAFVDGRSFLAFARDPATPGTRNAYLIEHWLQDGATDRTSPDQLEPPDPDQGNAAPSVPRASSALRQIPEYHGVRTGRWMYVEYATGERELYDLSKDPYELHNIVTAAPAGVVAALHREVDALKTCHAAGCRVAEDAPVPG
jgi:arylsulfatase A-like enzyme